MISPSESIAEAEYIAPYPYSSNIDVVGQEYQPRLSVMSSMAIDAAVEAWKINPESKIVIAGETLYGSSLPNTTDLMVERAKQTSDIDDGSLVPLHRLPGGTLLNNTYLQTAALKNYFGDKKGGLISSPLNYHLQRVMHTARAYGLESGFTTAEQILDTAGINDYSQYEAAIAGLESSERTIRLINRIDQKGRLFNLMSSRLGGRLVDVIEVNGRPELLQTTARKKVDELAATYGLEPIRF
ncbi:MAG TPA: hypothetical protein VMT23_01405 [Candidatus Binatia bacterium]|nr:hypothetical protein [Candidatus Binatia bacterium]